MKALAPVATISILLLGVFFPSAHASQAPPAVSFFSARSFAVGYGAHGLAAGDLNRDGKLDVVVTDGTGDSHVGNGAVSVLLGKGDGTFQPAINYQVGSYPVAVAVADFNRDGKLDLAVGNSNGFETSYQSEGSVSLLLGNGDGTFQAAVNYFVGYNPTSIAVGDFNKDGKIDLIVADACGDDYECRSGEGAVSVLLGNGNGTFSAAIDSGAGPNPVSVTVGDFNGDGIPDAAVANYCPAVDRCVSAPNTVSMLLGKGDGSFQAPASYDIAADQYELEKPTSLTAGDFNHDGKLDLAVAVLWGEAVGVLLGKGDGTFQAPSYFGLRTSNIGSACWPAAIITADLNGDGKPDLAVRDDANSSISVLLGNGDGTFQRSLNYAAGLGGTGEAFEQDSSVLVAGDFNGDGRLDLATASSNPIGADSVTVALGSGGGAFKAARNYTSGGDQPMAVVIGDFNGDGRPDLAMSNYSGSGGDEAADGVSVLPGAGLATFGSPVNYNAGGYNATWITSGDFNRDGLLDLAVSSRCVSSSNCANGTVSVLLAQLGSPLKPAVTYAAGVNLQYLTAADLNGDGKQDLVIANAGNYPYTPATGSVSVLLGKGDGTFQPARNFAAGGQPWSIAVGDFNRDGKLDLAVVNAEACPLCDNTYTLAILQGNGDGSFHAAAFYQATASAASIAAADLNGDGKLDLVTTGTCSRKACAGVLLGNGDGTFQPVTDIVLGTPGPLTVSIADMNLDGVPDLVAVDNYTGVAHILLDNGNGAFEAPTDFTTDWQASAAAIADLNGDRKPDLVVVNWASNDATVLLNNTLRTVKPAPQMSLAATPASAALGSPVVLKASVHSAYGYGPVPTGWVTFLNGGQMMGSVSLKSGTATFPAWALRLGMNIVTAKYSGDGIYSAAASSPVLVVITAPRTTTFSPFVVK